jgi:hypothetical protein
MATRARASTAFHGRIFVRAGAKPDPQWFEEVENRHSVANTIQSDPRMMTTLRGELAPY